MSKIKILKDIPDSDVNQVIVDFKSEGCSVEKIKQTNGKWTVKATCPEK